MPMMVKTQFGKQRICAHAYTRARQSLMFVKSRFGILRSFAYAACAFIGIGSLRKYARKVTPFGREAALTDSRTDVWPLRGC